MVLVHKKKSKTKFGVTGSRDITRSRGRKLNISKSSRSISKSKRMKYFINLNRKWFSTNNIRLTECIRTFIFNYTQLTPDMGSFESIVYNINEKTGSSDADTLDVIDFTIDNRISNNTSRKITNIFQADEDDREITSYQYGSIKFHRNNNYINSPSYGRLLELIHTMRNHGYKKAMLNEESEHYPITYNTVSVYNLYFLGLYYDPLNNASWGHVTTLICCSSFYKELGENEPLKETRRFFSYDSNVDTSQNNLIQQTLTQLNEDIQNECITDNPIHCDFEFKQNFLNIQYHLSREYLVGTEILCQSLAYITAIKVFTDDNIIESIKNLRWEYLATYLTNYYRQSGPLEILSKTYGYILNAIDGGVRNSNQLKAIILQYNINPKDIADKTILSVHCSKLMQQNFGKSKKTSSEQQQRQCPKEPAKLFNLGTKKLGLNKKYWKVVKDKKGIKRWVLYAKKTTR